jgi:hypothetical protein
MRAASQEEEGAGLFCKQKGYVAGEARGSVPCSGHAARTGSILRYLWFRRKLRVGLKQTKKGKEGSLAAQRSARPPA